MSLLGRVSFNEQCVLFYILTLPATDCCVCSPIEYTIILSRQGSSSLGFSVVGGVDSPKGNSPIYVKSIAPKSIAANDGRLQVRICEYQISLEVTL